MNGIKKNKGMYFKNKMNNSETRQCYVVVRFIMICRSQCDLSSQSCIDLGAGLMDWADGLHDRSHAQ